MSAQRPATHDGALTERERTRLREAYATVPASRLVNEPERREYSGGRRRGWCRRCEEFSVVDDGAGGRCERCGGGLAGYAWVEADA
jgi:hypothetical protein